MLLAKAVVFKHPQEITQPHLGVRPVGPSVFLEIPPNPCVCVCVCVCVVKSSLVYVGVLVSVCVSLHTQLVELCSFIGVDLYTCASEYDPGPHRLLSGATNAAFIVMRMVIL